jgi:ABC-2 type transport system permease protein
MLIGSIVHGIGDELGGATVRDIVVRMGGSKVVEQAFVAAAFCMLGMMAAAFAVSLILRLHQEEAGQRAETLLSGSVSRNRWLTGHLVLALAGSALAIVLAGAVAGLAYGIAAHDVSAKLLMVVGTALIQLPAVWLPAAVTVALFGLAPRLSPVVWGVLVGFVALYLIGELSGFPQWVLDLEPFAHIPLVTRDAFTPVPLLALLAIDAALIMLGLAAFRRRDVQT